jgi:phage N-6-adenine-methyltransferase
VSLVGFKARNHQQQVLVHGPRAHVDDRALPPEDFAVLQERFVFTIDVAAASHNAKLPRYYTIDDDGLAQDWTGERVYCNPPYSSIEPWLEKAHSEWLLRDRPQHGGPDLIVMLLPANRTEQGWWQRQVEPYRDRGLDLRVEFLPGRLRFLKPGQKRIAPNERPPFGCCLLIWESIGHRRRSA